jgi:hypothetical protein
MQTWLVHMREPRRALRDLGWPGFIAFQLMIGGSALAAIVHPIFLIFVGRWLLSGQPVITDAEGWDDVFVWLAGIVLAFGYAVSGFIGYVGLARRNLHSAARTLIFTPIHWILLSIAAWRALLQLIHEPYKWEKTEHGLAKNSRFATMNPPSAVPQPLTDTAAGQRRRPQRYA